jgi:hypothetical protein
MKICPTCNLTYADETLTFCLDDGSTLSASYDPPVTQRISPPRNTGQAPTEILYPASNPSLQPTIASPQSPPLAEKQPIQSKGKRSNRTGLILGVGVLLGIILTAVIAVSFIWLGKENKADNRPISNITNANRPPVSTPTPTISVAGRWSGSWENTQGVKATSTIRIVEETNGLIKGDEDGWVIENGSRKGNVLTWEYHRINNGCRDYQVQMKISDDGKVANGTYEVIDRCENKNYSGSYIDYKKQ